MFYLRSSHQNVIDVIFVLFRVLSAIIAVALTKSAEYPPNHQDYQLILSHLDLPGNVKKDLKLNLGPYLQAVVLSGFEEKKMRKMMVMGNTGN